MNSPNRPGGIIHSYQKYDPQQFPLPAAGTSDLVSPAFEHLLWHGSLDELTEEELAEAIEIDPSQIVGFLPSISALTESLMERKRRILKRYESTSVREEARRHFYDAVDQARLPQELSERFRRAIAEEQIFDLERLSVRLQEGSESAGAVMRLIHRLGIKYQIDELDSKYEFTGHESMAIPKALEVKEELEWIDRLLEQLANARRTGRIYAINMDALQRLSEPGQVDELRSMQQQMLEHLRQQIEAQGIHKQAGKYELTPRAYRLFQSHILEEIFSDLQASRSGRHEGPISSDGAIETPLTKPYEFGDSVSQMDTTASLINALVRQGPGLPIRLRSEDIEIHKTRNAPKCATCVLVDMSGSMRFNGLFVQAKRMALALSGLIYTQYPGDPLQFIEVYSFARLRHISELASMMPRPVTVFDPVVRLQADMSREDITESMIPPHFTNIQHALRLARRYLGAQDTPNRQVMLITDGLPTAHFEDEHLFLLYPPDPRTERATIREAMLCKKEGITINIFLLSTFSQTREDIQFANRMAEQTGGRVFYVNRHLDRYVVWNYLTQRRTLFG